MDCGLWTLALDSFPRKVDSFLKKLTPVPFGNALWGAHRSQLKVCANRMQNQASLNYAEVQPKLNNEVVTAHKKWEKNL